MNTGEIWVCVKSMSYVIAGENYEHKYIDGRPDRYLVNVGEKVEIIRLDKGSDNLFWVYFQTLENPILLRTSSFKFYQNFKKVYYASWGNLEV